MVVAAATAVPRTGQDAIVNRGIAALRQLLPPGWKVDLGAAAPGAEADTGADVLIGLQDPQGVWTQLIVEAKPNFAPRDVETLLGGQLRLLRRLDPTARVVIFAPWLSPRTRALLEEQKVGYLDLTGNVRLQLDRPAIVIRTTGAPSRTLLRQAGAASPYEELSRAGWCVTLPTCARPTPPA